jgi:signal peptidase I
MFTVVLLTLLLVVSFFVSALALWLSAMFLVPRPVSFRRALLTLVVSFLVGLPLAAASLAWAPREPAQALLLTLGGLVVNLALTWLVFSWCLRTTFARAILVSLPWFLAGGIYAVFAVWLMSSFVVHGYYNPTNAMAPTLIGAHYVGVCPHCKGMAVVPYVEDEFAQQRQREEGALSICENCFRITKLREWNPSVLAGDRFLCNKLLAPQRWDIIVFRYPRDPDRLYSQRLIGLPGEQVLIKEGSIWIDGKKLEPPDELKNLRLTHRVNFGNFENIDDALKEEENVEPVRLGPNGYFVVGDFTLRSSDSRDWGEVPAENLVGVVTVIYWPPERWRVLR